MKTPQKALAEENLAPEKTTAAAEDSSMAEYQLLLSRCTEASSASGHKTALRLPRPLIALRPKLTLVSNFGSICKALRRPVEHVLLFMQNECATTASIQGDGQGLVLKGRYKDKQVCSLLSRYVGSFVKCPACGSSHATTLERDPRRRIDLLRCVACDASTAVANVRDSGYQAAGRRPR